VKSRCDVRIHGRVIGIFFVAVSLTSSMATAQPESNTPASNPASAKPSPAPVSTAERIATLQRSIDADAARSAELKAELDNPAGVYATAEQEFKDLDGEQERLRKELKQAETDQDTAKEQMLQKQLADLKPKWEEAKRRFDLEIESRQTRKATLDALTTRMETNKTLLERLRNPEAPAPTTVSVPTPATPAPEQPGASTSPSTVINPLAPPGLTQLATTPVPAPSKLATEPDEAVTKAEAAVQRLTAESAKADAELGTVTGRVDRLKENIALERRLRDLGRQKVIEAEAEAQRLRQTFWQQLSEGNDASMQTREQVDTAQERLRIAQAEAQQAENHLDELQSELSVVQAEQIAALQNAENRRKDMERARETLERLSNPWAPHRIEQWLLNHGVRVVTIVVIAFVVLWIARHLRRRLTTVVIHRSGRGTSDERENRARTLVNVFHSTFGTFVYGIAIVLVLEEVGFSVAPLLGGAAVLGLAIAFGAQSLIKDYFTGFIILLEQQYMLNDVVQIGELSGQVERITLRMTVLRAQDGKVHFIPHGTITSVTNMTHGWSRALFAIQVGYDVETDRVCRIISELGRELRRDPAYSPLIIEDLVMLGVNDFQSSGVELQFYIATRPLQQWTIKREMLRRIKQRFDQEGIVIPLPQLVVHPQTAPALPPGGELL
jgi:small-conductance mechanosensitive channel